MASARMQRLYLALNGYNYRLFYKRGKENLNDDALSRPPLTETVTKTPLPMEIINMTEKIDKSHVSARLGIYYNRWTKRDPVLARVLDYTMPGWPNGMTIEVYRSRLYTR